MLNVNRIKKIITIVFVVGASLCFNYSVEAKNSDVLAKMNAQLHEEVAATIEIEQRDGEVATLPNGDVEQNNGDITAENASGLTRAQRFFVTLAVIGCGVSGVVALKYFIENKRLKVDRNLVQQQLAGVERQRFDAEVRERGANQRRINAEHNAVDNDRQRRNEVMRRLDAEQRARNVDAQRIAIDAQRIAAEQRARANRLLAEQLQRELDEQRARGVAPGVGGPSEDERRRREALLVLGLNPEVPHTVPEINDRYRRLGIYLHPDKATRLGPEVMQGINAAVEFLRAHG